MAADYIPPVGSVVLFLAGDYIPAIGAVQLYLTAITSSDQEGIAAGQSGHVLGAATGSVTAPIWHGTGSGITGVSAGAAIGHWVLAGHGTAAAQTGLARGQVNGHYDVNLLTHITNSTNICWQQGDPLFLAMAPGWLAQAITLPAMISPSWQQADRYLYSNLSPWQQSDRLTGLGGDCWQQSDRLTGLGGDHWQQSDRITTDISSLWQQADRITTDSTNCWIATLPHIIIDRGIPWQQADRIATAVITYWRQGQRVTDFWRISWAQGAWFGNVPRYGPPKHPPLSLPWNTILRLDCPLPGTILVLGKGRCPYWPEIIVPTKRTYFVLNSASLVRLSDGAPLPCTNLTISIDCDSWNWALTATLVGPDAWSLIQPNPLPIEVVATINGLTWQFVLNWPNHTREFAKTTLVVQGNSRSAWLTAPYTLATQGIATDPANIQQLADAALTNTGWTLDWQLVDYLVPANLYTWHGTPIDQLIALVKPLDGCIYTDPAEAIMTAYARYPTPAWTWEGMTPDVRIPDAALISWTRKPDIKNIINGAYVGGTQTGVLAWVKKNGTAGDLQPAQPIIDALLCDIDGVAARARGISVLSQSGIGWLITADTWFSDSPGLLQPGMLLQLGDMIGMCRSTHITADWSSGLRVRQGITMEVREYAD